MNNNKNDSRFSIFLKFLMMSGLMIMLSGFFLALFYGIEKVPDLREVKQINILNNISNNNYIFSISFNDCKYTDYQIWNNQTQLNNYLKENYHIGDNIYTIKKHATEICVLTDASKILDATFLIVFGLSFIFLTTIILTCLYIKYEMVVKERKILPVLPV